ncbi:MAG: thioredoxin-dependent thiol peroxidase [Schleiferiaceae bacterium]|nr:thioredoxin-dependent thiol peroxidase [Schleiferiaceae bacterium]
MTHLKPGDEAPSFAGVDQHGNAISNEHYKGKKVVLYFYPKDDTPGCTAEACDFNNNLSTLQSKGFEIIGVSPDSVKKHDKFATKYGLSFPLIADEEKTVIQAYGVWGLKKFMGREYEGVYRETFVINEEGMIEHVITKVQTKAAADQILALYQ